MLLGDNQNRSQSIPVIKLCFVFWYQELFYTSVTELKIYYCQATWSLCHPWQDTFVAPFDYLFMITLEFVVWNLPWYQSLLNIERKESLVSLPGNLLLMSFTGFKSLKLLITGMFHVVFLEHWQHPWRRAWKNLNKNQWGNKISKTTWQIFGWALKQSQAYCQKYYKQTVSDQVFSWVSQLSNLRSKRIKISGSWLRGDNLGQTWKL